ncbi:hypothetical protein Golax_000506 [Gossypium laxum]|uniref:Uncharacterized protein n=1 Tax=Gossypium laxum TaxID=34288 RepID=A0A7J9ATX0_9ROSI|nr:hypothetical protein [Gossypium laxum]
MTEKEALLAFQNGLKPWVRQEVEQRDVQKLSEAMMDYKEDVDDNGNDDNSGNGKPRFGKKKPKRKRDMLKCFLCDDPHMLKKCLKKFALKEKLVSKALVAEVPEEICHRRERWSRQGAQKAWFEQKKSQSQKGKEEQKEARAFTQGRGEFVIGLRGKSYDENSEAGTNEAQIE